MITKGKDCITILTPNQRTNFNNNHPPAFQLGHNNHIQEAETLFQNIISSNGSMPTYTLRNHNTYSLSKPSQQNTHHRTNNNNYPLTNGTTTVNCSTINKRITTHLLRPSIAPSTAYYWHQQDNHNLLIKPDQLISQRISLTWDTSTTFKSRPSDGLITVHHSPISNTIATNQSHPSNGPITPPYSPTNTNCQSTGNNLPPSVDTRAYPVYALHTSQDHDCECSIPWSINSRDSVWITCLAGQMLPFW